MSHHQRDIEGSAVRKHVEGLPWFLIWIIVHKSNFAKTYRRNCHSLCYFHLLLWVNLESGYNQLWVFTIKYLLWLSLFYLVIQFLATFSLSDIWTLYVSKITEHASCDHITHIFSQPIGDLSWTRVVARVLGNLILSCDVRENGTLQQMILQLILWKIHII